MTVRLDDETYRSVVRIAKASRRSKAEVVRQEIAEYARGWEFRTAYDAWKDVVGIAKRLPKQLSQQTGRRFTRMLLEERRTRKPCS